MAGRSASRVSTGTAARHAMPPKAMMSGALLPETALPKIAKVQLEPALHEGNDFIEGGGAKNRDGADLKDVETGVNLDEEAEDNVDEASRHTISFTETDLSQTSREATT